MTFAMKRLATRTRSACWVKSSGPGWILYCWKPASMTAAVAEVGKPRVRSGTSVPGGRGVVCRFRAGDALNRAGAEFLRLAAQPFLHRVAQKGRNFRAAGRQCADRKADRRAAQPGLPGTPPVSLVIQIEPLTGMGFSGL